MRSVASQGRSERRRARRGRGIFQQENIRDLGKESARSFFGRGAKNSETTELKLSRSFLDVLSCLSVGTTLGIRLGYFRYGSSRLGAYVQAKPALLGERKFPLPGSGDILLEYSEYALAIPTLRFAYLCSWCRFRY